VAGKAGLKAGLIGVAVLLVTTLINQVLPMSGGMVYALCGVNMLIYVGIGVLAGLFLAAPRAAGTGAGAGAIAGLISGMVSGVVGYIILAVRMARGMGMPGVDPQQMQQLVDSGMDPMLLAIPGAICGVGLGVGMAAIGGAILAAVKPD
jgi:hypothetical protein